MLDQPPPSPALQDGVNPGMPSIQTLRGPQAGLSAQGLPPDVLTGMLQTSMKIAEDLSALAQMTPDLASDWAQVISGLSAVMAKVVQAGGGPVSPTATGPQFPGGGFDQGGAPLASGGGRV